MNQLESTCLLRCVSDVLDRVVSDLSKNCDDLPVTIVSIVRLATLRKAIDALIGDERETDYNTQDDTQKGDAE